MSHGMLSGSCDMAKREKYWEELTTDEKIEKLLTLIEVMAKVKNESGREINERLGSLEQHSHDELGRVVVPVSRSLCPREVEQSDNRGLVNRAPKGWSIELSQVKDSANIPIPMWQSHKAVVGFQILAIEDAPNGESFLMVSPRDGRSITVSSEYMKKHKPEVGGYHVRYADGYESYSPAKAFEEGYSRIY